MAEQEKWKWQEPGTAWKGVGLYHVTLTIPDRRPLLGRLEVPGGDVGKCRVLRTALGNALVDCLISIQRYRPEVQVLHFCLMPDHLHAVLYVRRSMDTGIRMVVRGFWQGAKKLGRAWTAASLIAPNKIRRNCQEGKEARNGQEVTTGGGGAGLGAVLAGLWDVTASGGASGSGGGGGGASGGGASGGGGGASGGGSGGAGLREATGRLEAFAAGLREEMGETAYYGLGAVFTEMPFIRPMGRNTQLPNTIQYIDMNPQRLATKRLRPGFFRVQRGIGIGGRSYDGVGNTTLLMSERFAPVHVRSLLVRAAEQGDGEPLRNYKNSCVVAARQGVVMVSPFISADEKQVMEVLVREQRAFICLTDNGFRDYYKPFDGLFDACAAGRVLILSPWPYDAGKRHISRADCVALNKMAEEICESLK